MVWNPLADGDRSFDAADAPAPLFRDPVYDGAADPSIMWHRDREEWWILYTQRRATVEMPGRAWIHGSEIGVATSDDGSRFLYRGTLDLDIEPGHNTHWAPEILHHDGTYHLFVSYLPGVPQDWVGPRYIVHATSPDMVEWTVESRLSLSSEKVIDPDVHRLPDGTWRMWYKDESDNSYIYAADSDDLFEWAHRGAPVLDNKGQEAPIVFEWQDSFWMLTDSWDGISAYRSPDGREWTEQDRLLTDPGKRPGDDYEGGHPDAFVVDGQAYVLYHVHQSADGERYTTGDDRSRRTVLQVAELAVEDGTLTARRDAHYDPDGDGE